MSRTISDKIRLIIDANPNKALAQIKRFNAGLRRIAIGAQQVQMALASVAFVAGGAFVYLAKEVVTFDDAMRKVQSKLDRGLGADKLEALTTKARELGRETSYTATEVAGMMKALAQSGKSADEILGMSDAMVMFGRASDMGNLEESTELLTKMLDMFGKGASDAEHFSDVLIYGANNANTNVRELAEGMRMLGPLMSSMATGSFEKSVATLAVLANSGESGGRGGRGARSSQLQAVVKDAQAMYQELGIEVKDVNGNLKNQVDLAAEVSKKMKEYKGDFEGINALVKTNGKIGLNAALITGKHADEINEMRLRMMSLVDETKLARAVLEGGVGGALRRLKSALDGLVHAMGKDLIVNLALLSETLIKGVIEPLTRFIASTQNFGSKLGLAAVAASAGSLAAGLTAIAAIVVSNVISAFSALALIATKTLQGILGSLVKIATRFPAVTAIAVGLTLLFKALDSQAGKTARSMRKMLKPIDLLNTAVNGIIDSLVLGDWEGAMDIMEKAWAVAVASMRVEWGKFVDDIKEASMNITGWLGYAIDNVAGNTPKLAEAGKKAAAIMVDEVNKGLADDKKFAKEGGLFDGFEAAFKENKQYEFPKDMADALGGQRKANAMFKKLRREFYEASIDEGQYAVGANEANAMAELKKANDELNSAIEQSAAAKADAILAGKEAAATAAEEARAKAQEKYETLKTAEAKRELAEATAAAARAEKIAKDEGRKQRWQGRLDNFTGGMEKAMNRTLFVAKTVGPKVWSAYFFEQGQKTRKFKKDMNEVKDVVKSITFGKLGSFDIGTAQAELNAKLNDTAARQLEAQLRIAKSNDEINEVLKRNGVGLRVGN